MIEMREFDLEWEGRRCLVEQLGAMQARQVARRLINVVGTAIRESAVGAVDREIAVAGIMASGAILERLDDATIEWLTQTFLKVTRIEREAGSEDWLLPKDVQDLVFGGGPGLARWLRWMSFCLDMSCADFFAAAFAEARRLQTKASKQTDLIHKPPVSPSPSPSPSTSSRTGTFTA
jgi:hypothetical protein